MKEQIAKITDETSSSSTKQYLESSVERGDRRSIYAFLGVSEFWTAKLSGGIVVQIKFLRAPDRPVFDRGRI